MAKKLRWGNPARALSILCCFAFLSVQAAYAQNQKVTLRLNNATVATALQELKQQTGLEFFYSNEEVDVTRKVTFDLNNANLSAALRQLLGSTYRFEYIDNMVVIKPAEQSAGRDITVTGVVSDAAGQPLIGVAVIVKGTTRGTSTDITGRFSLTVRDTANPVFIFSYIGKETAEIPYTGQREINVTLKNSTIDVEEIVVTGIFNRAKESYTGAVTTITARELQQAGNTNLLSQIGNMDPSFMIMENNVWGSDPNTLPEIRMRGNTSLNINLRDTQDEIQNLTQDMDRNSNVQSNLPLFIVDGFETTLRTVMDMDPYQVESVTLLKDASATAMYGSRGANGIVVIVTKKPEVGRLRFSYKGDLSISAPDLTSYNLMNAEEKLIYEAAAGLYGPYSTPGYNISANELYSRRKADVERGVDTYWLKYPVHVGVGHRHSMRADGGSDNFLYAVNLSYDNNMGVMKESKRNTLAGSMYMQYSTKNVQIQNELSVTSNKAFNSPYGEFSTYASLNQYWSPYDSEGKLKTILDSYTSIINPKLHTPGNPLYDATLPYKNEEQYNLIQNNFAVNWNIMDGLSARGRFKVTKQTGRYDEFYSPKHSKFFQYEGTDYTRRGQYIYRNDESTGWEGDITINYSKVFANKHQLAAGLNVNIAEDESEANLIMAEGYAASNMYQLGLANSYMKDTSPSTSDSHWRRVGAVTNVNYTYDNRYFADFSGKLDGSSVFGADKRVAPFWSAGIGWNAHHEKFVKRAGAISTLRLRLSYGTTGSQNFSPYQSRTTFQFYKDQFYHIWSGAYMMALGNSNLKWQITKQFNGGFELGLLANRIRIIADYYNKITDGLLVDINVPPASGFDNYKANMGKVRNWGYEINISAFIIRDSERRISWSVGASMLHNKNEVLKISNALESLNNQINSNESQYRDPSFPVKEGESLNTIFAVKSLGIDPSTGQELFLNRYGKQTFDWDWRDRIACGTTDPKLWGNINTSLRVKNISLNVIFSYRTGGYAYNSTLVNKVENVDPWMNVDKRVYNDRWREEGDNAKYKSIKLYYQATNASTRFVIKDNTFECRSINLSYEVPSEWSRKHIGVEYLALDFYTEDVFRISSIRQERGTTYPFARKFSMSLKARF